MLDDEVTAVRDDAYPLAMKAAQEVRRGLTFTFQLGCNHLDGVLDGGEAVGREVIEHEANCQVDLAICKHLPISFYKLIIP